jgi:hypothetical protein
MSVSIAPTCWVPSDQTSLLAEAVDLSSGKELAYTYQDRIPLSGAGVDASGIPVTIQRPWSPSMTVTLTAPDALPLGSLAYEESSAGTTAVFAVTPQQGSGSDHVDAGIYVLAESIHPGYPDAVQIEGSVLEIPTGQHGFLSFQGRATRITPPTSGGATIAVDLTNMLPAISSSSIAAAADAGAAAPSVITWTSTAPLTEADAVVAWWSGSTSSVYMTWTFFGPGTTTSFTFPSLPAAAPAFNPTTFDFVSPILFGVDVSFFAGYGDFKGSFTSFLPGYGLIQRSTAGIAPILPALGSARFTSLSAND